MLGYIALNTVLGMIFGFPFGWFMKLRSDASERGFMTALMTAILSLPAIYVLHLLIGSLGALPDLPFPSPCGYRVGDPGGSILAFSIAYPMGVLFGWRMRRPRRSIERHIRPRRSSKSRVFDGVIDGEGPGP